MKYTELVTIDGVSHFMDRESEGSVKRELGTYSKPYPTNSMMFRDFELGNIFDWHPAPQSQYIIYLEGEVEITASNGEKCIFKAGEILFANDTSGKGHISRTLTKGRAIIITTKD